METPVAARKVARREAMKVLVEIRKAVKEKPVNLRNTLRRLLELLFWSDSDLLLNKIVVLDVDASVLADIVGMDGCCEFNCEYD